MLDSLLDHLAARATRIADVTVLQPVDPFLETAGEEMRRRIFITATNGGETLCLRPEFTIPICLAHVRDGADTQPVRLAYGGTVFRQQRSGSNEFEQAGLEDLGRTDRVNADADCLTHMLGALDHLGAGHATLLVGDQALFRVLVASLKLPESLANRLVRAFGKPDLVERLIQHMERHTPVLEPRNEGETLAAKGDAASLTEHVAERMVLAGLSPRVGRSPSDIAERMIANQREADFRLGEAQAHSLRTFLSLTCPLSSATAMLDGFAGEHGLDFGDALVTFDERVKALTNRQCPMDAMTFRASFGRNLEYYSGLVFDAEIAGTPIAGGGRYDQLCTILGSEAPVPAVGFSVFLDRVRGALS